MTHTQISKKMAKFSEILLKMPNLPTYKMLLSKAIVPVFDHSNSQQAMALEAWTSPISERRASGSTNLRNPTVTKIRVEAKEIWSIFDPLVSDSLVISDWIFTNWLISDQWLNMKIDLSKEIDLSGFHLWLNKSQLSNCLSLEDPCSPMMSRVHTSWKHGRKTLASGFRRFSGLPRGAATAFSSAKHPSG